MCSPATGLTLASKADTVEVVPRTDRDRLSPDPHSSSDGQWSLVLNATYQPLTVVPARRAALLVLAGRAVCVEATGERLRAQHRSITVPAVIRLNRMVRASWRTVPAVTRRGVLHRDDHRCAYCGDPAETVDHVQPRSRGGAHDWTNVVAACAPCNNRKSARTPQEASMPLGVEPAEPRGATAFAIIVPRVCPDWQHWFGRTTLPSSATGVLPDVA